MTTSNPMISIQYFTGHRFSASAAENGPPTSGPDDSAASMPAPAPTTSTLVSRRSNQRRDQLDYYIVYSVAFLIFLVSALIQRCVPRQRRFHPCDTRGSKSLLQEVHSATRDLMPFAFMG